MSRTTTSPYRVLQILPARLRRRAAILEDCHTLDASLFRPRELARMQLRVVRPAPVTETAVSAAVAA